MCNYQQLSMNAYGYVVNYPCCQSIELAFYTTVVRMDNDQLKKMHLQVSTLYHEADPDADHNVKRFGLQIDNNTRLALTMAELEQLKSMIEESQLILQAYEIIKS